MLQILQNLYIDNDNSEYKRYKEGINGCVYKELEASFQSNIDENFPQKIFMKGKLYQGSSSDNHMFDICILPKVKEFLEHDKKIKLKQNFVLRFTLTDKTNRITNIEQLSIHKDQQPFPRNVRRLINRRNTIYFYFQSTDEYIQEWKKRYCLLTLQQQKYFYSFILCICAVMKYIECEFSHQMISFPYKKSFGNQQGVFASLDDSDVQRHKRDFELWNGFFIPPEHQFQTSQISQDSVDIKNKRKARYLNQKKANVKSWYKSLAIVEPLKKFIYENKDKKDKMTGQDTKQIFCSHQANQCDTLWLSNSTQDVYCNRCAILLQFSECIRKFVLECENREVTDFLWPWYRNYFHRRDVKKYHTYVAKYNLSHLFRIEDVLEKEGDKHDEYEHTCKDNACFCCCRGKKSQEKDDIKLHGIAANAPNLARDESVSDDDRDENEELERKNKIRTQIRHLRKFAAHVLLGGWDILRNLNVIRNQLQCIFGYFNGIGGESDNEEDSEFISNLNAKQEWKKWRRVISKCNKDLRDDLNSSTARKLMKLHHEDQLSMKPKDQSIFSNLIDTILTHSNIYDPEQNSVIDGFHNGSFSDLKLDKDDDDDISDTFDERSEAQESDKLRYYQAFKQSWKRVPDWWFIQHDQLLLELALKFNWDKNLYHRELTDPAKKQYYQVLLTRKENFDDLEEEMSEYSQSLDDDDDDDQNIISPTSQRIRFNNDTDDDQDDEDGDDYVGYQEFQVWCENWRNIQHRLRYLTFVICDYFYKCSPSMVAIRIPIEQHRIEQYRTESIAFLNGYMARVHILNYKQEKIDLNNINEAQVKLKKIAQDYLKSKSSKKLSKSIHGGIGPGSLLPLRTNLSSKQSKSSQWSQVLKDTRARRVIQGNSSKRMAKLSQRNRIRDPFMKRDLNFELEQICQSFDLLEYGVEMATFLIKLLKRKQLDALWSALGIVLEYMPYEFARHILEENQEDLRHGKPEQLKTVCDRIMRGSSFNVHIALFLADYMQNNAKADLARYDQWMKYSKYFEQSAGATINTIESNHLLAVLLDIPLTYSGGSKVSLLQVALEQNRAEFLNNERINAVMAHVWQSPSGLAPNTEIMQQNDSYFDIWWMLFDKPYHFYLTPMGFNATIKTLHLAYLLAIFLFVSQRVYLDSKPTAGEWFLWSLNIGYILYECIEAYDKSVRVYLSLAGWVNYWDMSICAIWISLFGIRLWSVNPKSYQHFQEQSGTYWGVSQAYMMLWAIQTASISTRSLVLFQTSNYFGVLLRMMLKLMAEMFKFMFVLALLLLGFVFGLYYIQGGYDQLHVLSLEDWYEGFKYLFQLTVGAGDFSEIEDLANEVTAQLFVIGYLIIAAILMMNLLIALLTTTYEMVHTQQKTASSFAFAESTYDLSHRSRFMPAPICIYIFVLAIIIHVINFIPAMLWPQLNIYNCINHYQYQGFDGWRMTVNGCLNFRKIWRFCKSCISCKSCKRTLLKKQSTGDRFNNLAHLKSRDLIDSLSDMEKHESNQERRRRERCFLCCKCACCEKQQQDVTNPELSGFELITGQSRSSSSRNLNGSTRNIHGNRLQKDEKERESEKVYSLTKRGRICKYYSSTFCCCAKEKGKIDRYLKPYRFEIYHNGCYSCIPTALGAKQREKSVSLVNGITLNEYAELYEKYHQFNLDQADIVLLKHLTVDSLFCRFCYRPFDPKNLNQVLLTPFWALSEIISIYAFPWILWLPLCIIYGLLTLMEVVQDCLDQEHELEEVDDYDRQYFAREALTIRKTKRAKIPKIANNFHDSSSDSSSDSD